MKGQRAGRLTASPRSLPATPLGNVEECYRYFSSSLFCHGVRVRASPNPWFLPPPSSSEGALGSAPAHRRLCLWRPSEVGFWRLSGHLTPNCHHSGPLLASTFLKRNSCWRWQTMWSTPTSATSSSTNTSSHPRYCVQAVRGPVSPPSSGRCCPLSLPLPSFPQVRLDLSLTYMGLQLPKSWPEGKMDTDGQAGTVPGLGLRPPPALACRERRWRGGSRTRSLSTGGRARSCDPARTTAK